MCVFCTINPNGINQITFVMETHLVYCAVGNDSFSTHLHDFLS